MKNYDDLQRFKDKTRTGDIHFKDLSAQNKQASGSGWAIINQLAGVNSDAALAKAGSVAVPVPQAVQPGELDAAFAGLAKAPVTVPAGSAPSILQSVSADKETQTPLNPTTSLFDQLRPEATSHAVVKEAPAPEPQPVFHAAPAPLVAPVAAVAAPKPAEPVRFEQLFATKTSARASHPVKDLPLQPLLEKIASCR